jgi:hypothetical protein
MGVLDENQGIALKIKIFDSAGDCAAGCCKAVDARR